MLFLYVFCMIKIKYLFQFKNKFFLPCKNWFICFYCDLVHYFCIRGKVLFAKKRVFLCMFGSNSDIFFECVCQREQILKLKYGNPKQ